MVRQLLQRYQLQADKNFGQNFLVDAAVLDSIVQAATIDSTDTVLEIGPGLGVLTRELLQRAGKVVSVELDKRLIPLLQATLQTAAQANNFELVQGDALEFPLETLPPASLLVANLPYNVATTLVMKALESGRFQRLVFLVQKEVAERLLARVGDAHYGALSLLCQHFAEGKIIRHVKPSAFMPAPKVTSSVVRLVARADIQSSVQFPNMPANVQPDHTLFRLIRQGFAHRRKTLKKNLLMAGHDSQHLKTALASLALDERIRAEALTLAQFRALQQQLVPSTHTQN